MKLAGPVLDGVRLAEGVEHVHGEPEKERQREEDRTNARQPIRRQPRMLILDRFRGRPEAGDWWNHATAA